MPYRSVLSIFLVVISAPLVASRLGAEGFVCAGHAVRPPIVVAAKPGETRDNPVSPHGRIDALVIFAQFKDEAPDDMSAPAYVADLFDPDLPGSLTHFYHTMSFGQLMVQGMVLPRRYTSDQPEVAYLRPELDEPGYYSQFVLEILRQVDADVDLARFDSDGPDGIPNSGDDDGIVDYVFVCVRSTPYGFLLKAATGIAGLGFDDYHSPDTALSGQPIRIRPDPEWGSIGREGSLIQTVGMMAHEFGHALGLPDLYDLEYAEPDGDSAGIGRWGLMGWGAEGWNGNDGPNPLCAWSLEQLNWITKGNGRLVEVVEETTGIALEDLHAGGAVVKVPLRAASVDHTQLEQDYLLLEHRTRAGSFYNRSLPAEGLLLWRVHPHMATGSSRINNLENHKGVDLVCADGLFRDAGYPLGQVEDPTDGLDNLDFWSHDAGYRQAHAGNMGDATDPFDGVRFTRLDPWSNPASAPAGFQSSAPTTLGLSLHREGEAMVVDLVPVRRGNVTFEVPGREIRTGSVILPADQATLIRVSVRGEADTADLMAYALPQGTQAAEIPMVRHAIAGAAQVFEAEFGPSEAGVYQLLVRLQDSAGAVVLSAAALHLWFTSLEEQRPDLVFLGGVYAADEQNALRQMFEEALGELGLDAGFLLAAPQEGSFYQTLLADQDTDGALVVWLGQTLDERGQVALRAHLERGGRLLLVSQEFHTSPGSGAFLEDMLHATAQQAPGSPVYLRSTRQLRDPLGAGIQPGCWLGLSAPSVPLLIDHAGNAAAIGVDSGTYRVVYLAFGLHGVKTAVRRSLIESSLAFLVEGGDQDPHLKLGSIIVPSITVRLGPVAPRVAVDNWGARASEGFRVGYQVLLGDEVVGTRVQVESPLAALTEREIVLPVWEPDRTGPFHIRFGLGATGQEHLAYGPVQLVYVADVGEPYAQVALPGEVSEGHGAGFFDYDNDGDLDLYLVRQSKANQLFRNEGAGFTQQAEVAGVADVGQGWGLALGDYDGDGDLDLYVVNEGANRFFRNEEDGTFVDITTELDADPVTTTPLGDWGRGRSAGFFDVELDGDLDLYLVNGRGAANRLYRNGEGGFAEDAASAGLDHEGDGRGLAMADYDGDGDVDLFVARTKEGSRLCRNDGGTFAEVHEQMGLRLDGGVVVAVFGDYDNDGDPDLFVSDQSPPQLFSLYTGVRIFRNDDGASFLPARESLFQGSHAAGAAFLDHDNDGDLDLVTTDVRTSTPAPSVPSVPSVRDELYHNLGGYLVPVGSLLELEPMSTGRGVSVGDYDGDGDMDWFVADELHSRLYRNQFNQNHWLQVDLAGIGLNPDGLGARIQLSVEGNRQYREVHSAYGYCSQVQPWVHFGLGAAAQVDTLRVRWPDGQETVETDMAASQHLVVKHPSLMTAVVDGDTALPTSFELGPNYPNPFNPSTIIQFAVPAMPGGSHPLVTIAIYDLLGQGVRTVVSAEFGPGVYRTAWDGRDDHGRGLASGAYLYRMRAGDHTQARKLLLIR